MKFNKILKNLREEKNITQLDLAKAIHISRSDISKYENSQRDPSINVLMALSDYFNVSILYLLGIDGNVKTNEGSKQYITDGLSKNLFAAIKRAQKNPSIKNIELMDKEYLKIKSTIKS